MYYLYFYFYHFPHLYSTILLQHGFMLSCHELLCTLQLSVTNACMSKDTTGKSSDSVNTNTHTQFQYLPNNMTATV